jgi:hypothetical protein
MADTVTVNPSTGVGAVTVLATDDCGANGHVQIVKLAVSTDGTATALPLETLLAHGTYGYASGVVAGTVDVPAGARVKRVSVLAGGGAATITIAGGATITVPAGTSFDEQIAGDATLGGDVVIGGMVSTYYVSWTS